MDIGIAIFIIGLGALAAAFCLLVIGVVYAELMDCDIPRGVDGAAKLHMVHCMLVGMAVIGRILDRLGLCSQVRFTRWATGLIMASRRPVPEGLRIKDLTFAEVPVRVYEPTAPSSGKRRGLVYFHGGGWVSGSIDTSDEVCRYIAIKSETTVVSVGYRLAPEHRYPTQLDDCEAATCHFLSVAADSFGVDPCRVAVGGDSVGGNLAAALCQRLAGRHQPGHLLAPCAQVLIYPALQMADFNLPSYQQNGTVPILLRARVAFYFLQYLCGEAYACPELLDGLHVPAELKLRYGRWLDPNDLPAEIKARGFERQTPSEHDGEVYHLVKAGLSAEVSPLLADDAALSAVPPAFVLTCEYDVLRDEGIFYTRRLEQLGVPVTWHNAPDSFHGVINFYNRGWLSFASAERVLERVVDYVKTL
ncbi:arylacetamide deacetylase-like 4 isoform X1 [Alosa alosa]|nr:arylacetamide deacetylase-like 4 isoform X1 [Alosa alosa]